MSVISKFYEFLGEQLCKPIPLSDSNRQDIKKEFFSFLYEDNKKYVFDSQIYKVMNEAFPDLVEFIVQYKREYGYKKPAQMMQKVESDIIINYVSKEALALGIIFTQIYDSILCLEEDQNTFNNLIKEGFKTRGLIATTNLDMMEK